MKKIYAFGALLFCIATAWGQSKIEKGDVMAPITSAGNNDTYKVMGTPCNPPIASDTVLGTCDSGMVKLQVNTGGNCANWYGSGSGSMVGTTSTFQTGMLYNDTSFDVESVCPDTAILMGVGTHSSTYTGNHWVRGYWFTAPKNFHISGLRVPTDAATSDQSIEVVRFTLKGAMPIYTATTDSFVSLGYFQKIPGTAMIPTCIEINSGDRIGIYGVRGDTNSYSGGTVNTAIDGSPVTLLRSFMQDTLSVRQMHDISTTTSGSISRVEMYYSLSTDTSVRIPLNVTVPQSFNDTIKKTICQGDSIMFAGQYLKASGVFTDSLTTVYSCDSIPILKLTVSNCAGIDEANLLMNISAYPNPTSGVLIVNIMQGLENKVHLEITDYTGRTLLQYNNLKQGNNTINFNGKLSSGIYMLRFKSGNATATQKLIVE